jgi:archaetidylinositol phosphate synthase
MNEIRKRPHYYVLEKLYTEAAIRVLPRVARLGITPNQITFANLVNGVLICGLILMQHYWIAAILIQVYLFLDILDGNLARYREMSSKLGAVLDNLGDRFFYNAVMIAVGHSVGNHWGWIVFFLFAHNSHAALATYYIVPRIRKMAQFRRFGIKQRLMDRGYILGMDLSTQDILLSVLLVTPWRGWIVPVVGFLYVLDLLFRLLELRVCRII